jgi:hypothetical protein
MAELCTLLAVSARTLSEPEGLRRHYRYKNTCLTGTKVQILHASRCLGAHLVRA